jgi:hypothetical protein
MKAQKPAEGISKVNDFGHSIWYRVECECLEPDHCHTVDVAIELSDVTVEIYTQVSTPFWSKNRWKMIWEILTKGYAEHEACIILNKQSALNYAKALKDAVKKVEDRENDRQDR